MTHPARQRIRQAFDRAATTYDAAAEVQREVCDQLAVYLRQVGVDLAPQTILDAGCGTGYGAVWLQQCWPRAALTLVDFAAAMLMTARARCADAALICADIEALPIAEHSTDLYWSSLAWQWNDPHRCVLEADRVLKTGGVMAVATLGSNNFPELRHVFAEVDEYSHVLTISPSAHALKACQALGWQVPCWQQQPVRRHYADLKTLLRSVKDVGAREVEQRRPVPFSRSDWQRIIARYERLRESAGLPLTYDVAWLIAVKP
jgi:malonyl-CoA O-methyltransferase